MKSFVSALSLVMALVCGQVMANTPCTALVWVDRGFEHMSDIYDRIDELDVAGCPEYLGIYDEEIWDLHSALLDLDQRIANGECPEQEAVAAMNGTYAFLQLLNGAPCPIPPGQTPPGGIAHIDHPAPTRFAGFQTEAPESEEAEGCGCGGAELTPEQQAKADEFRQRIKERIKERRDRLDRRLGTPTLDPTPAPTLAPTLAPTEATPQRIIFSFVITLG